MRDAVSDAPAALALELLLEADNPPVALNHRVSLRSCRNPDHHGVDTVAVLTRHAEKI